MNCLCGKLNYSPPNFKIFKADMQSNLNAIVVTYKPDYTIWYVSFTYASCGFYVRALMIVGNNLRNKKIGRRLSKRCGWGIFITIGMILICGEQAREKTGYSRVFTRYLFRLWCFTEWKYGMGGFPCSIWTGRSSPKRVRKGVSGYLGQFRNEPVFNFTSPNGRK